MRPIVLSSAARPAVQNFSTLSHRGKDLLKNVVESKICDLIFFYKI
jgi:hypothetical protein